ncbi:MAG: hypothetical protein ACXU8N_10215 [Telluria sp.]
MFTSLFLSLLVAAVLAVMFKPLLTGLAKAAALAVLPRLSREELAARAQLRNARLMQRMINSAIDVSDAAELRALSARG